MRAMGTTATVIARRDITVAPLYLDARSDVREMSMIVSL